MKPSTFKPLNSKSRLKIRATDPGVLKIRPLPPPRGLFYYTNAVVRIYVEVVGATDAALRFCNPTPYVVTIEKLAAACWIFTFLTVRSDQDAVQCKTREGRTARVSLFCTLTTA